jgi:hypothetical protein
MEAPKEKTAALFLSSCGGDYFFSTRAANYSGAR